VQYFNIEDSVDSDGDVVLGDGRLVFDRYRCFLQIVYIRDSIYLRKSIVSLSSFLYSLLV